MLGEMPEELKQVISDFKDKMSLHRRLLDTIDSPEEEISSELRSQLERYPGGLEAVQRMRMLESLTRLLDSIEEEKPPLPPKEEQKYRNTAHYRERLQRNTDRADEIDQWNLSDKISRAMKLLMWDNGSDRESIKITDIRDAIELLNNEIDRLM